MTTEAILLSLSTDIEYEWEMDSACRPSLAKIIRWNNQQTQSSKQNFGRTTGGAFSKFLKCSSPHLFINRIHKKFSLFAQRLDISSGIATVESKFAKKAEIDGAEFQV